MPDRAQRLIDEFLEGAASGSIAHGLARVLRQGRDHWRRWRAGAAVPHPRIMNSPNISNADILQALDESRAERDQQLDSVRLGGTRPLRPPIISDRLALAICTFDGTRACAHICDECRHRSTAVAHELAAILRERHGGSSQTADWLDAVNSCNPQP